MKTLMGNASVSVTLDESIVTSEHLADCIMIQRGVCCPTPEACAEVALEVGKLQNTISSLHDYQIISDASTFVACNHAHFPDVWSLATNYSVAFLLSLFSIEQRIFQKHALQEMYSKLEDIQLNLLDEVTKILKETA